MQAASAVPCRTPLPWHPAAASVPPRKTTLRKAEEHSTGGPWDPWVQTSGPHLCTRPVPGWSKLRGPRAPPGPAVSPAARTPPPTYSLISAPTTPEARQPRVPVCGGPGGFSSPAARAQTPPTPVPRPQTRRRGRRPHAAHPPRRPHLQFGHVVQVPLDALLQELDGRQQRPRSGREDPQARQLRAPPPRRASLQRPRSCHPCAPPSSSTRSSRDGRSRAQVSTRYLAFSFCPCAMSNFCVQMR